MQTELSSENHRVAAYATSLPPVAMSAGLARRFVRDGLAVQGLRSDDAELVASELVANVACHAGTPVRLELVVAGSVRIEVMDGSAVLPAVSEMVADAESGRGLFIVAALAARWGVEPLAGGKCVWAEVQAEPLAG